MCGRGSGRDGQNEQQRGKGADSAVGSRRTVQWDEPPAAEAV
jgi:hypothetical protein